uniref:CCHC-type domain-containing protein n=1 Tax=Fagus sylvatica TaxID=28930 RepID=A0A2N9FE83_FAGSY
MEPVGGSEPGSPSGHRSGISYKESLLGTIPGAYERAFFGSSMEEDEFSSSDEDDEPPAEGEVAWDFSSLNLRIGMILKMSLGMGLGSLENHFLSIRPWVPDFRASDASVSSVAVWVRLPELPVEYYHKDSLMHIGSGIGPVLRVDFNTASGTRGRFARLCIQIELDKPLIRTVRVGKIKLAVVYEGIGLLCFKCGKLGHKQEWCPAGVTAEPSVPHESSPATSTPEENLNGFGPWMLVSRRKRQTKSASQHVVVDNAERGRAIVRAEHAIILEMTSTKWGLIPILKAPPSWSIQVNGKTIQVTEDIIDIIRKDPLHVWGWYSENLTSRLGRDHSGSPTNRLSRTPSPNRFGLASGSQPVLEFHDGCPANRRNPLSFEDSFTAVAGAPINSNFWRRSQTAKCVPKFEIVIRNSELKGAGFLVYHFKMAALMNTIWEIWPEKAWNSLEAKGSLYPTLNPPFMSAHEIGLNVLTWNCRGVLNPCFRRALLDLLNINDPAILILTETRLGGARAAELAKSFPFDGFLCTNTIGFAGGIWILWKAAAVELELLTSTEQEIHVSAQVKDSNSLWLLSAIYASPRRSERRVLWKNLMVISGLHNLPWVMVGDFNDIISGDEKWGGNSPVASRIAEYNNCMNTCSMLDLGFSGPKYTWSNGQDISTLIMQRLDRAWVNSEWRILFPEAYVTHLTRTHSDHCPILLSLWPSSKNSLPRPFRFENIWLSHPEFPTVVDKAWAAPCPNLSSTFDLFTSLVTTWNKNTFGNIFQRKKRTLARITGMQVALATNPSEASARLEKSLRMEYGNILKLEEDFWALKSRVGWVVEGDRNTKFFHTTTLVRRRYNKIVRIRNNMGDWIVDSQLIRNHIQQGFIDLFSTSHVSSVSSFAAPTWAPCVSVAEALNLTTTVLPLEIKESLWSLKPFKAPGPDGLHPGFFQHSWHQVDLSLIISYLLYQTAFVPGRRGVDNVIIAQELIHTIQKKKGRLGHFILKIDLEKAYDRIEWSFIREVLILFKFPMSLVQLILECISSSSCAILYNGGQMDFFQPTRGIRQGDPLSPYIFILCMEYLSLKIFEACNAKTWKPIRASRRGPAFSHLFFADDLLLCAEASTSCCLTISRVLEDFCCVSGQKINLSKSKAFFSPNVRPENRTSLCDILKVSSTPDLGRYLGFPLKSNGRNTRDSNFIVERVQAKLSNWKAKLLSPAGRLVLIQAVTSAVPAYYMQSTALPSSICTTLDRINRNFLWGSSEEKKKMHMVGWDKICRAKSLGGLGLYACKPRNVAMLAKLNWRLLQEKDALWARTILAKYSPNGVMEIDKRLNRCGSSTWRGIKKGHEVFRKGLRWVVRNGQGVSFWHDKWVGENPLRDVIQGPLPSNEDSIRVCDVVEGVGNWDLSRLSMIIPKPICDSIRAIPVCPLRQQEDCIAWDSRNGEFCLKLAYLLACKPPAGCIHDSPSNWIWKVPTSPRIRFFLWQCYHNSVPVRDTLVARGINIPNTCPRCLGPNESLIHVSHVKVRVPTPIKWKPPDLGWAKLNTDGASLGNPGIAGGGGLIRDSNGDWVGGFARAIGVTTSVQAELRALKDGLMLAIDLGIPYLAIEMDSLVAVEFVNSKTMPNVFLSAIVADCRCLLERFERYTLHHIFREANGCADALAKAGCTQLIDFISFISAPAHVLEALAFDSSSVTRIRLVCS